MSLFRVFDIAGTGMSAQSLRLNVTASNVANANNTSGTEEGAYRARQPVFATFSQALGEARGGVKVLGIVESDAPVQARYAPEHPLANADGYVFSSNVNAAEEMVNMLSASRSYQNNIEVINTSKDMLIRTLSMGQ